MISAPALFDALRQHRLIDEDQLVRLERELGSQFTDGKSLAEELLRREIVTSYQGSRLLHGDPAELCLGQHVVLSLLGEGGMGQVFKARHRLLKRIDAIKVIRPDCLTTKHAVERFYRESQAVASLNHPNIVRAYDAGRDGDRHFFVMEFVQGIDLDHLLVQQGQLSIGQACDYIRQAALGLQHAHEKAEMVHRDIKPSNLLLATEDQTIKILDMGLARLRDTSSQGAGPKDRPLTAQGMIMGTPDYMAPEQAEDSGAVDIRADIYSLGCSLHHLLTGNVPFPGGSLVEKLTRHFSAPVPSVRSLRPEVPRELDAVVLKMMAKHPDQRYRVPADVADALQTFCSSGTPLTVAPRPQGDSTDPHGTAAFPPTLMEPRSGEDLTSPNQNETPSRTVPLPLDFAGNSHPTHVVGSPTHLVRPTVHRSLWVPLAVVAVMGAVCFGVWFGFLHETERQPDPVVKNDDPKKETDKDGPKDKPSDPDKDKTPPKDGTPKDGTPRDKDNVKDKEQPPKPNLGSGEGKKAEKDAGEARADDWDRSYPLPLDLERVEEASFSAAGDRLLVRQGQHVRLLDSSGTGSAQKYDLLKLLDKYRVDVDQPLGSVAISPSGRQFWFTTVSPTDQKVKGAFSLNKAYDTIVRVEGQKLVRLYGDVPRMGETLKVDTTCFAVHASGDVLFSAVGFQLRLWVVPSREDQNDSYASQRLNASVVCLAASVKHVVAGCVDKRLYVYKSDLIDDKPIAELVGLDAEPRCVAFVGPTQVVAGDAMGNVCWWTVPAESAKEPIKPLKTLEPVKGVAVTSLTTATTRTAIGFENGLVCWCDGDAAPRKFDVTDRSPVRAVGISPRGDRITIVREKKTEQRLLVAPSRGVEKGKD